MLLRTLALEHPPVQRAVVHQLDGRWMTYYAVRVASPVPPRRAFLGVRHLPMPLLLESAAGLPDITRRSVLVCRPSALFVTHEPEGLLGRVRAWWERERGPAHGAVPAPGPGVYGLLAYEAARGIERLPATTVNDLDLPVAALGRYDAAAVWDHAAGACTVWARSADGVGHAAELMAPLLGAVRAGGPEPTVATPVLPSRAASSHDWPAYRDMVERVQAYIRAGDVFQANLAQRLDAPWAHDAWTLYDRLMGINPSPFSALADFGDWQLASCSPERLVTVRGDHVETRPIAGTRPRGRTVEEDAAFQRELRVDPKECAEHVMIADMARNDIGRVCEYGTVRPASLAHLEAYSHVWHITSSIVGRRRSGVDPWHVLGATFPGASITGVPKVRCMEIIDELERTARGPYTGSLGWVAPTGDCDWNILIRTIALRAGRAYAHVGGGIVADSDARREYAETWAKAAALLAALGAEPPAAA